MGFAAVPHRTPRRLVARNTLFVAERRLIVAVGENPRSIGKNYPRRVATIERRGVVQLAVSNSARAEYAENGTSSKFEFRIF